MSEARPGCLSAILSPETAYGTGRGTLYRIDLGTGGIVGVGNFGGGYESSGDCAFDEHGSLYMSADSGRASDVLVRVDTTTGAATPLGTEIGFDGVFGLSFFDGRLFGFASGGWLIRIDTLTGRGTPVVRLAGVWYGAASAPGR